MSALPRLQPADKGIFAMVASSLVAILLGMLLAHMHKNLLGDILFFLGFTALFALPSVVGLHIYFNESRTPPAILWVESILVGILVMLATQILFLDIVSDTPAAIASLALGISFALLPLFSRTHAT
jgi:hypothetical protein